MDVYIYGLVDPSTNELRYVGKTIHLKQRLRKHMTRLENNRKASWIKNLKEKGIKPELVILEVIEDSDDSDWQKWESWWIAYFLQLGCRLTNLNGGGQGGIRPSDQTRQKQSLAHLGKTLSVTTRNKISHANKGVPKPLGFPEKLRKANLGKLHSIETKNKLSNISRSNLTSDRLAKMLAGAKTPEAIAKSIESYRLARLRPDVILNIKAGALKRSRPIMQFALDGTFVARFNSTGEAFTVTGVNRAHMGSCANGRKGFKTAGGFLWKYA